MQSFLGYKLSDTERADLLERLPAAYPSIKADHITIALERPETLPHARQITLLGMADDGIGAQALVVAIDNKRWRDDGTPYHLTWSVDPAQMAPAHYDANPDPEQRVAQPYRAMHSGGMILFLERNGLVNWFAEPVVLPGRTAVFDDRTGTPRPDAIKITGTSPVPVAF